MNTDQMLLKLTRSENENVRILANRILSGETTKEQELRYTGSFMTFVLKGDYDNALRTADHLNYFALTRED